MEPRRERMDLGWGEVSYLEWAPAAGAPAVVLLHGGGIDNAELSWGGLGGELAEAGYRVLAPDHPGFGQSPPAPWRATQRRLVAYTGEFTDALGLSGHVIGGLSLGGGMTLGSLLRWPGRARAALLLGTYGIMPRLYDGPAARLGHAATWAMLRSGLLTAMTRGYAGNRRAMERGLRALVRDDAERAPLVDRVMSEAAHGTGFATFRQWQDDQVAWDRLRTDYTGRLSEISTPALLVHGARDTGVPLARAEAAARLLPDAELVVVPGAGHWVQRDRPGTVAAAVTAFLAGLG